jgi:ABC-type branched-subunit amino acid transport system ATPase component
MARWQRGRGTLGVADRAYVLETGRISLEGKAARPRGNRRDVAGPIDA